MKQIFVFILIFLKYIMGRDDFTIKFVQSYIENERKPTDFVYIGLCWGKKMEVNLVNELAKLGIRASSSLAENSSIHDHDLFFFDLECPEADNVFIDATSNNLFDAPFRWLVLSNPEQVNITNSNLWSCPLLVSSDLVLAERTGDQVTMTELHKPSLNYSMQFTPRGFYNGSFFDTRPHREMYRRRRDLMGHGLTMANVIQDSNETREHLLKENRLHLYNDAVAKACWATARHLYELLNATRRHIFSYRWGYKVNGEWSGMIGDIEANKADFGILFKDRLDVVTYTDVIAQMRMRFVFRQPPLTYTSNIFSLPFSSNVWVALVVISAAVTLMLFFTSIWEVQMERSPTQLDGSLSDALLLTLSAVAQQGCFIEPTRAPGRIMEWFFFAALMALYAAYSANIVVLLQAPSNSIQSLAQLASSKITLAAADVDYNRFIFSQVEDSVHVQIFKRIIPEDGPPNFYLKDEGVEKIREGLFALHSLVEPVYRRIEETFKESEKCDLSEVDFVNGFDGFIPVKKGSPYLELIRVTFKQLREFGIQNALSKRFMVMKPRCVNHLSTFSSVGLLDMRPVLIFMLYGVAFSILIFVGEVVFHKLTHGSMKTCFKKKLKRQQESKRLTKIENLSLFTNAESVYK